MTPKFSNKINYAPPIDIPSFQLTVTEGCSHNGCSFCTMFHRIPFRVTPMEEIENELRDASSAADSISRVFLSGGDAFVLPAERLLEIAELVYHYLPKVEMIASYASVKNIMTKSDEELSNLAKAGIGQLNIGIESGLDDVLTVMNKGFTIGQARKQLFRLNDAKLSFSVNIIGGAAGSERIKENALASAAFCNEVKPGLIYFSPIQVDRESRLFTLIDRGKFKKSNLGEFMEEEFMFLQNLELKEGIYFAAHMLNPVELLGYLPEDKERMMSELNQGMNCYREKGMLTYPLNF